MGMTDLKLPKKSEKEMKNAIGTIDGNQEQYPWGTRLELDDETVKKLGIEEINTEADVTIKAVGSITNKNVDEMQGGKKRYRITIQIKKMEIEGGNEADKMDKKEFIKMRNEKGRR